MTQTKRNQFQLRKFRLKFVVSITIDRQSLARDIQWIAFSECHSPKSILISACLGPDNRLVEVGFVVVPLTLADHRFDSALLYKLTLIWFFSAESAVQISILTSLWTLLDDWRTNCWSNSCLKINTFCHEESSAVLEVFITAQWVFIWIFWLPSSFIDDNIVSFWNFPASKRLIKGSWSDCVDFSLKTFRLKGLKRTMASQWLEVIRFEEPPEPFENQKFCFQSLSSTYLF